MVDFLRQHKYILISLLFLPFILLILFFYPTNKISRYLGGNRLGAILVTLDLNDHESNNKFSKDKNGSTAADKYKNLTDEKSRLSKVYFFLLHIHLNNPSKVAISYLPANLLLKSTGKTIYELYRQSDFRAYEVLRKEPHLNIFAHIDLKAEDLFALGNFCGVMPLYRRQSELDSSFGKEKNYFRYVSGKQFVRNMLQETVTPSVSGSEKEELIRNLNLKRHKIVNFLSAIILKLAGDKRIFDEQNLKKTVNLIFQHAILENISRDEITSLLNFYRKNRISLEYYYIPFALSRNIDYVGVADDTGHSIKTLEVSKSRVNPYTFIFRSDPGGSNQQKLKELMESKLSEKIDQDLFSKNALRSVSADEKKQILSNVKIQILNGSGVYRQAKKLRNIWVEKGYNVQHFSNLQSGEMDQSLFLIRSLKPELYPVMESLKKSLSQQYPHAHYVDLDNLFDITFIIGKDFFNHE